ncbi:MAG: branched-chain amino acid ABC transporter permease [Proteobacteria bacterium]|nr:branched-chain amino acid ABC transporter permease [Pseudomonadota bacterium]
MIRVLLVILGLAGLAGAPLVVDTYYLTLMVPFFGYAIALLGLNLLFGYTGLLSFGHALFIAIGAYVTAALTSKFQIRSYEVILLAALASGLIVAVPVGAICIRYQKIFFGMLTLAFGMLFHSFLFKFYSITGGDQGMRVLRPTLLGLDLTSLDKTGFVTGPFYYYCLAVLVLAAAIMWRIVSSPFGLHLRAIRDNAGKAAYLGVGIRRGRLIAFVISGGYGAIGGTMLAVQIGLADPELAYWTHSGNLVFMVVLGGFDNFFGPLLGALIFILLQDQVMSLTQYWRFVFGAILAAVVILAPRGLMGLVTGLARRRADGPIAKSRA